MASSSSPPFDHNLPGFRFIPTDEELVNFYLEKKVRGKLKIPPHLIIDCQFYRHDPWELSTMSSVENNKFYYFFVPRDRTHPNGSRPKRVTRGGYWKATGTDNRVCDSNERCIGLKKTLVFYRGRAPRGNKTNWVMNEYRLPRTDLPNSKEECDVTLCRMHQKNSFSPQVSTRTHKFDMESNACISDQSNSCPSSTEGENPSYTPGYTPSSDEENSAGSSAQDQQKHDELSSEDDISQLFVEFSNFDEIVLPELKVEPYNFGPASFSAPAWLNSPGILVTPRSMPGHFLWEKQCFQG